MAQNPRAGLQRLTQGRISSIDTRVRTRCAAPIAGLASMVTPPAWSAERKTGIHRTFCFYTSDSDARGAKS